MPTFHWCLLPLALYIMACNHMGDGDHDMGEAGPQIDPRAHEIDEQEIDEQGIDELACPAESGAFAHLIGQPYDGVRDDFPVGDRLFGLREPGKIYTTQAVLGRTLVYIDKDRRIVRIVCG